MSGFEVIGVVLGVWPVVVNGLTLYKAAKDGRNYDLLLQELKTEEIIYNEFVHHLLASDVSEADLIQLSDKEQPNLDLWSQQSLHDSLKMRLGSQKSQVVLKTLEEMGKLLANLNDKMAGGSDVPKTAHAKFRNGIRTLKYSLPSSGFKQDLESLKSHNSRLQRLLTNGTGSGYSAHGRLSASSEMMSPDTLRQNSMHANDLWDAICDGYRCSCPFPHKANLGLRQIFPKPLDASDPFELLFPLEDNKEKLLQLDPPSPDSQSDESLGTLEEPDTLSMSDMSPRCWSPRHSVDSTFTAMEQRSRSASAPLEQRSRSLSFCKSEIDGRDGGLIDDLCIFIKNLGEEKAASPPTSRLGVLALENKKYTIRITSLSGNSSSPRSVVCLDDYLAPYNAWELSWRRRMDLALSLSLAILQFYSTPWIDMWWTWKDFCMLKDDKSQVFVTGRFYSAQNPLNVARKADHSPSMSTIWDVVGEPILTRLGFALIELALGKRLSELRPHGTDGGADQDLLDLIFARQLVERGAVLQEAGQCYHDAVQACLTHQVMMSSGVKGICSKHKHFQQDLERFVVAPIRDYHTASWGQISYG